MPTLDPHDPHLAPIFRRATLKREQQDQRLADIFGTQTIPRVTAETLAIYLDYLKQHLEFPCQLTGIEDRGCFAWEEYYRFVPGREEEHERRQKKEPSCRDTYVLLNFEDEYDAYNGIDVKVRRIIDKKRFVLPLAHLKATEKQSKNYQLLDDYVVWFVNGRR